MQENNERRIEKRLRYQWPMWFADNPYDGLSQGHMVDVSSKAAAFICDADYTCPETGQEIISRFSVPVYGQDDSFELSNFTLSGRVFRIEEINPYKRRVAFYFSEPLPFKPGEQTAAPAFV